jgi:arylsulfatase A-like enzyme
MSSVGVTERSSRRGPWSAGGRRFRSVVVVAVVVAVGVGLVVTVGTGSSSSPKQPNIVFLMTDDSHLREHDVIADMRPNGGFAWVRSHGLEFNRMWSTDNVCCPGRTTALTGQTAYNHHILEANKTFKVINNALPSWMQDAGYETGFAGKYLNLYGVVYESRRYRRPPGWTYWEPLVNNLADEFQYTVLNRDDKVVKPKVFQSDWIANTARAQLDDALDHGKPAFVAWWATAPHFGSDPAAKYANTQVDWKNTDGAYLEKDLSDKPPAVQKAPKGYQIKPVGAFANAMAEVQLRDLLSIDDQLKSLIDDLRHRGQLENTVFIVTSDNGYLLGEHQLVVYKEYAYEAAQMPFMIAGPGFPAGEKSDAFVTNLDIAPTIARIAGATTHAVDGRAIQDILRDPQQGHERFLPLFIPNVSPTGQGVKTWRYKYVQYKDGSEELYDLQVDPYELESKNKDPQYATIKSEMQQLTQQAITCKGPSCRVPAPRDLQGASMKYPPPPGGSP